MPQAAKAHTKAGAKAFVEHFWQAVNYAQATGDTAAVADLADPKSCSQCNAGIKSIDRVYGRGGAIRGGSSVTSNYLVRLFRVQDTDFATVEYDITVSPATFDYPGDTQDNSDPATRGRRRARLAAEPGNTWRVVLLEGLS